jgi:hypothetical protein
MNKTAIGIVVAVIVIAGGWYAYAHYQDRSDSSTSANDLGTYPYVCDNGSTFALTPLEGMQAVRVSADAQGMFTGTATLAQVEGTSYKGAAPDGQEVAIMGDGETVHMTVGSNTATCNPKPNPDAAPWNWGDPDTASADAQPGSVKPSAVLVTGESIEGTWQDNGDPKSEITLASGGAITWIYDGKDMSSGTFAVFTKDEPKAVSFPIDADAVYLQTTDSSTAETQNFKIQLSADADTLTLIYMDRGGATTYSRVE